MVFLSKFNLILGFWKFIWVIFRKFKFKLFFFNFKLVVFSIMLNKIFKNRIWIFDLIFGEKLDMFFYLFYLIIKDSLINILE